MHRILIGTGLVLVVLGLVFVALGSASPLTTVTVTCGTFTTGNPGGTSSSAATNWPTSQAEQLSATFALSSSCNYNPTFGPYEIAIQCVSGCGSGPTTATTNTACGFCIGGFAQATGSSSGAISFFWGTAVNPGITLAGTSAYPASAVILVDFRVFWVNPTSGISSSSDLNVYGTFVTGVTGTAFDFALSASPTSLTSQAGGTGASTTVSVSPINAYPGPTSIVIGTSSSAIGCTLPLFGNPIQGPTGSLMVTCTSGIAGSFTLTVTGTWSGSGTTLTHVVSIPFIVTGTGCTGSCPPDFTLTVSPASIAFPAGGSGPATVTGTAYNGFTGTVTLSTSAVSNTIGGTCSISPTSMVLGPPASAALTLTATSAGSFVCTVTGTSGTITHTLSIVSIISGSGSTLAFFNIPVPWLMVFGGLVLTGYGVYRSRHQYS